MASSRRLVLSPGVSLREVDGSLVVDKPGMRVTVHDERSIGVLKRASLVGPQEPAPEAPAGDSAPDADLEQAIEALVKHGLIEAGAESADRTNDYLVSLQGRYGPDLAAEASRRLEHASVAIAGEPWMAAQIRRTLEESGVGRLTIWGAEAAVAPSATRPVDLVVDLTWPGAGSIAGHRQDGTAVLPVVRDDDEILVGPVLGGSRGGRCHACGGPRGKHLGWADAPWPDTSVGVGLACAAALSYLSGLAPREILTMSVRYDLRTRQSESVLAGGDLTCPACGVHELRGQAAPHPTAQLAWRYEQSVEEPVAGDGGAAQWSSVRSQSVFRRRHFNMPPLRQLAAARGMELPGRVLSLLDLTLAADPVESRGKVTGIRYRRLPTVEGVGTSSVYLLPHEHALIRGGAYYDPYEGELVPLSWPTDGGGQLATRHRVCITGDFTGAEVCFGRFGRRVVFQDAGLLMAQLLHRGSQLGLRPAISPQWSPESIHSALDLAAGEQVLAVIDVDTAADGGTDPHAPGSPPSALPDTDTWLGLGVERLARVAPAVLDDLVIHCWNGTDELSEARIEDGKYLGRTRLDTGVRQRDVLRATLTRAGAGGSTAIVIGADLQAVVYQRGAAGYASLIQRAAALAHYLSLITGELGGASQSMLKLPARLLELSSHGRARHRVLSALVTGPPGPSSPEVSL